MQTRFGKVKASLLLSLCAFQLVLAATPQRPAPPKLDKAKVESHLRRLNLWGDSVQVEISDPKPSPIPGLFQIDAIASFGGGISVRDLIYVSRDGSRLVRGELIGVNEDSFQPYVGKLDVVGKQPSYGPSDAPVRIVVFADFECGSCKEEAEMLRENLREAYPKQVAVYFADYPLEQKHPWSKIASLAGRCVYRLSPAMFWDYHDWVFHRQDEIQAETFRKDALVFATSHGLNAAEFERCIDSKTTLSEIDRTMALGEAIRLNTLPTVFVNGRRMIDTSWLAFRQVIEFEIDRAKNGRGICAACEVPAAASSHQ